MNIYAKKGAKVAFDNPDNGIKFDQEKALRYLRVGFEYTIERTVVHSWHTDVYLQEVPGVSFNSVLFEDVVE